MQNDRADIKKDSTAAIVLGLAVLLFAVATTAIAVVEDGFDVYKLNVPGKLLQHRVEDLDGDGLKDILVVHRKGLEPDETRWVSVFWQDGEKGFATAPEQSWEIDFEAAVLDIGNVAGDSRKEICYLTSEGIRYYPIDGGMYTIESEHLFDARGLVVHPAKRTIPVIDFVRDWNGDGKDEVAIATFEGLSIFVRGEDGMFNPEDQILVELETRIGRRWEGHRSDDHTTGLSTIYTFPNVQQLDYNGDGLIDLIATTEDRVIVYLQKPDGTYETTASTDHLFDVRTQEEKIEAYAEIETLVEDLDGDGYADAVVTKQTMKGITNVRGVVNIFWGGPEGYNAEPDQLIISEGTASARAVFLDVNGDDRKDLVLPSIKFSIAAIIRILMTRSIKVYFNIFLLNDDGRISERPDFTKEVKFKIDFSGESDSQAMDLEGDYNADRRTDFVFATGKDELSVYLGEPVNNTGGSLFVGQGVVQSMEGAPRAGINKILNSLPDCCLSTLFDCFGWYASIFYSVYGLRHLFFYLFDLSYILFSTFLLAIGKRLSKGRHFFEVWSHISLLTELNCHQCSSVK